jgi:toxin ParE1/3/4
MRIVWLPAAQRNLISIAAYHESVAARGVGHCIVRQIVHSATALTENPHLGHPSQAVDGVHELHVAKLPYLLPYRVVDDRIEILRVFHEAQDRPATWRP